MDKFELKPLTVNELEVAYACCLRTYGPWQEVAHSTSLEDAYTTANGNPSGGHEVLVTTRGEIVTILMGKDADRPNWSLMRK